MWYWSMRIFCCSIDSIEQNSEQRRRINMRPHMKKNGLTQVCSTQELFCMEVETEPTSLMVPHFYSRIQCPPLLQCTNQPTLWNIPFKVPAASVVPSHSQPYNHAVSSQRCQFCIASGRHQSALVERQNSV